MDHGVFHVILIFFKAIQKQLMRVVMLLNGEKTNYLIVPEEILPEIKVNQIFKTYHFFITILIAVFVVIKILPAYSIYFAIELDKNSSTIPISILISIIPVSIIMGFLIEKMLDLTNPEYLEYKQQLKEDSENYF